jgi:hypothetical protein
MRSMIAAAVVAVPFLVYYALAKLGELLYESVFGDDDEEDEDERRRELSAAATSADVYRWEDGTRY